MTTLLSDVTAKGHEWVSLDELAARYNVPRTTIYALNRQGLPRIRVGRECRYDPVECDFWFDRNHREGDLPTLTGIPA